MVQKIKLRPKLGKKNVYVERRGRGRRKGKYEERRGGVEQRKDAGKRQSYEKMRKLIVKLEENKEGRGGRMEVEKGM